MPSLRVIGPGRAGAALSLAAAQAGWTVRQPIRRGEPVGRAASDCDLLVIATPDAAIAEVAAAVAPGPAVVAHLAGSLGLEVLEVHERRAAVHPLVSLSDAESGARRLRSGVTFAVAGDELARRLVGDLGGTAIEVADEHRAAYHAAACIASNHLVALLSQVERVAAGAGVPLGAYADLIDGTVENVMRFGPAAALTGPVARGDAETVARHRSVMDDVDDRLYLALADEAARLAGRPTPVGGAAWS